MFKASGAEYIVFVSKHHEGFTNWPSNHSFNWNSMAVGPKRDIVGELAASIKTNTSIHFGIYHSLYEWFNPLFIQDKKSNFTTQNFVKQKTMPELYELINTYKPDVIWSDGDSEAPSDYWQSKEFLAWVYNDSPVKDTVVTNDRWGKDAHCQHGGYLTCHDRYNPGKLQPRKWENAMTIDRHSWGFRRNAPLSDYLSTEQLLATFIETVSCGGNMLMNVGPTKEGTIHPIFEERLRDVGSWLNVNSEAIRSSRPWTTQNDTLTRRVWYTMNSSNVYALVLDWPTGSTLSLGAPMTHSGTTVQLVGYSGNLTWTARSGKGIDIHIPPIPTNKMPCKWAWAFKLSGLGNI
ncbi:hypothetical protein SNE40_014494 [Patella caerulea]